jgi:hypothetical protein
MRSWALIVPNARRMPTDNARRLATKRQSKSIFARRVETLLRDKLARLRDEYLGK